MMIIMMMMVVVVVVMVAVIYFIHMVLIFCDSWELVIQVVIHGFIPPHNIHGHSQHACKTAIQPCLLVVGEALYLTAIHKCFQCGYTQVPFKVVAPI